MKNYTVTQIPKKEAIPWLTRKHYAKKKPMILRAFGLYREGLLVGVCTFGLSGNMNNNKLGKFNILELNRLCVNDMEKGCCRSFFLGRVFRLLEKPLVLISYADTEMHHVGYIAKPFPINMVHGLKILQKVRVIL